MRPASWWAAQPSAIPGSSARFASVAPADEEDTFTKSVTNLLHLTEAQGNEVVLYLREIAETKMPDLNAIDLDGAMAQVAGTARSMGIDVVD